MHLDTTTKERIRAVWGDPDEVIRVLHDIFWEITKNHEMSNSTRAKALFDIAMMTYLLQHDPPEKLFAQFEEYVFKENCA